MAIRHIGVLTIGQAPRPDDTTTDLLQVLGPNYDITERGALDGLTRPEIGALAPKPGQSPLVTVLRDGTAVTLSEEKLVPLLSEQVETFSRDRVDAVVLFCGSSFPGLCPRKWFFQPQEPVYHLVAGLASQKRQLGIIVPLQDQVSGARATWAKYGLHPIVTVASPYSAKDEVTPAARDLTRQGADLIFLDCLGYTLEMKARAKRAARDCLVILPRSIVARILAECLD